MKPTSRAGIVTRDHACGGGLPGRSRPPRARGQGAARRASSRASPAPIAGGPTTTSTPSPPGLLGTPASATSPPTARDSPPRRSSARPDSDRDAPVRGLADYQQDGDRGRCASGSARSRRARALLEHAAPQEHQDEAPPPLRPQPAQASGRPCGPSPTSTASSRPTTTPNAASAAPSSTASSPSAASPSTASAQSNGSSQPPSPAASNDAPSSPTSPTSSPPASEATRPPLA